MLSRVLHYTCSHHRIIMFVLAVTFFALIRIIYLICMKKLKRHSISALDPQPNRLSAQAIYTSVIAPHYFLNNGENFNESVNASEATNKNVKYFEKLLKREDTFDGVDRVSESCDSKTVVIRPLTPAYKPHDNVPKEDPLGLLSVPPGFVANLSNCGSQIRITRITHSA